MKNFLISKKWNEFYSIKDSSSKEKLQSLAEEGKNIINSDLLTIEMYKSLAFLIYRIEKRLAEEFLIVPSLEIPNYKKLDTEKITANDIQKKYQIIFSNRMTRSRMQTLVQKTKMQKNIIVPLLENIKNQENPLVRHHIVILSGLIFGKDSLENEQLVKLVQKTLETEKNNLVICGIYMSLAYFECQQSIDFSEIITKKNDVFNTYIKHLKYYYGSIDAIKFNYIRHLKENSYNKYVKNADMAVLERLAKEDSYLSKELYHIPKPL